MRWAKRLGWAIWAASVACAAAEPLSEQRPLLRAAFAAAEHGQEAEYRRLAARLADHPLLPWLELAWLSRDPDRAEAAAIAAFLERNAGTPAAARLLRLWLHRLARRQDWPRFLAFYTGDPETELRCAHALARLRSGSVDVSWIEAVQALWRHGQSQPALCDAPFAELAARGRLDAALRWERIELAAEAGEPGLIRHIARGLPAVQAALAARYAAFIATAPHADTRGWPSDARSRRIAAAGLLRLARRDPDAAESDLTRIAPALDLTPDQRRALQVEIALWSAVNYVPAAARRLAALPADAYDANLHRWRLREALARGDDAQALAAIAVVPARQREGSYWPYFEARLRERRGQARRAHALYAEAAHRADFHGFLAADRAGLPYALCPRQPDPDPGARAQVERVPGLVRALELFRLEREEWAQAEWRAAVAGLDDAQRFEAVRQAGAAGWHEQVALALGSDPALLRYYRLRFPLPYARPLREQAEQNRLDASWLAAQVRAESVWMPRARSSAGARGLLQLLPGTARQVARRAGLPWAGAGSLDRPGVNLTLGAAYLRELLERFDDKPYLAIAAYNAGPEAVRRWRSQRPDLDPDFFIETIPFAETRDYVARVLAFAVIYDWRRHGKAVPLRHRLLAGAPAPPSRELTCPESTTEPAS